MDGREAVLLPAEAGPRLQVLGNPWRILVSAEQTGGGLAVVQAGFRPGGGAPAHRHAGHDECFYVLSGTFRFRVGDRCEQVGQRCSPGTTRRPPDGAPGAARAAGRRRGGR